MKLEHQFNWSNLETIYKRLDEDRCTSLGMGKVEFVVESHEGVLYRGVGYMSSVSRMNEFDLWKLHPTVTSKGKPINTPMGIAEIKIEPEKTQLEEAYDAQIKKSKKAKGV